MIKNVILSLTTSILLLLIAGCANASPNVVDRRNPEAVLRAYFEAWGREDWSSRASMMDEKFAKVAPEPVESIRIIEMRLIWDLLTERTYQVSFEIAVKGPGVSMRNGRYEWNFYLTWDANRDSWLITNYGVG